MPLAERVVPGRQLLEATLLAMCCAIGCCFARIVGVQQ